MTRRTSLFLLAALLGAALLLPARAALAQTVACGCSITSGALGACLDDIRALPADPLIGMRVINDIFRTSDGHDARTLTFAHYLRGLNGSPLAGCIGTSNRIAGSQFTTCAACNCPTCTPTVCTSYACTGAWDTSSAATPHEAADGLDWRWWQTNRGTPASGWTAAVADQVRDCPDLNDVAHCSYNPAHGLIYDLGGEANRVAIFAITDHTTDSCLEPFEWSVWLSDNADATDVVRDGAPPDPMRWNRARLDQIFLQGWTRNPNALGNASDTHDLTDVSGGDAQSDSPTVVFSLPCGITFRYASIVSGNYGNPGTHCEFNSSEDEVDAVAGLNADNTRLCADADGDGHRDRMCGGDDCDDHDAMVHPGAPETCSSGRDLNCDGAPTTCPSHTVCLQGYCAPECIEGECATGFTCVTGDGGLSACLPSRCVGMTCPAGQICGPAGCQDPCDGTHCPAGQVCRGGACLDPCRGLMCPPHQHCAMNAMGEGRCVIDCTCIPCTAPQTCNATSGLCEAPGCDGTMCMAGQTRDCSGTTPRCITPCEGVICPLGQNCDMTSGQCTRDACFGIACPSGLRCVAGACVASEPGDAAVLGDAGTFTPDGGGLDGSRGDAAADARRRDGSVGAEDPGPCGCRTAGRAQGPRGALALAALALAGLAPALRRRPRRRPRG